MADSSKTLISLANLSQYDELIKELIEKGDLFVGTKAEVDAIIADDPDQLDGRVVLITDGTEDTTIDDLKEQISTLSTTIGSFTPGTGYTNLNEKIDEVEKETANVTAEVKDIRELFS